MRRWTLSHERCSCATEAQSECYLCSSLLSSTFSGPHLGMIKYEQDWCNGTGKSRHPTYDFYAGGGPRVGVTIFETLWIR